jgi:hypothetical protein
MIGYGLLGILLLGCAALVWRGAGRPVLNPKSGRADKAPARSLKKDQAAPLTARRRLRWVALAFVPSSLMLSVTTYLTTDIAAIPLLWVIPLALYLLSFIIVFARKPLLSPRILGPVLPRMVLLLTVVLVSEANEPVWLVMTLHLVGLFVVALACHADLAQDRPSTEYLTEFYLWLSVGGVLGGIFNSLVAPLLFKSVTEYPLALVLACLLQVRSAGAADSQRRRWLDLGLPLALFGLTAALVLGLQAFGLKPSPQSVGLMFGLPVFLCYFFLERPVRFGLGVAAVLLAGGQFYHGVHGRVLYRERDFFGVHRVTLDPKTGFYHQLVHGNIVHGEQRWYPSRTGEPLTYFHRTSPVGQVFDAFSGEKAKRQVSVVGLGTGSIAAYAEPGQAWTYFEIDPAVERIARDERFFTFLADAEQRLGRKAGRTFMIAQAIASQAVAPGGIGAPTWPQAIVALSVATLDASAQNVRVALGDARLSLLKEPDHRYDLMVFDAFSSDAIPAHLLTREALQVYLAKLADHGLMVFHISNNHLNLEPVLGDLARDAGLICRAQQDLAVTEEEKNQTGKFGSHWVVMARMRDDLGPLAHDLRWHDVSGRRGARVWTDDFYNLIEVFEWDRSAD